MSSDENDKKRLIDSEEDLFDESGSGTEGETGTGTGTGGQSGHIEFHDFLAPGKPTRDDILSIDEKKRVLSVHKDVNEANIKKQKEKRDLYNLLKNGKISLDAYRQGMAGLGGGQAQFRQNPALDKAQFQGVDNQLSPIPNENAAETNPEQRHEFDHQYQLRNAPQNAPRFNPKPYPSR